MTDAHDTRQRRFAAEFALLDGPTFEELSLYGDLPGQADQLAGPRAERTDLKTIVTGLRSELAEVERQRDALRQVLAAVVDRVMQGDPDPLGEALDVLEQTGTGLLDLVDVLPRELLAVAA